MKSKKITVSTAIALLMMVATLFFVGCSTGTGGGSSSTNNNTETNQPDDGSSSNPDSETNQPGGGSSSNPDSETSQPGGGANQSGDIVTFETSGGISFIFNTADKTVVVKHPLKGDMHGSYEGNVNVDGKIRMYNNGDEMEGTISGSGKYLTAVLPVIGETTLTRKKDIDSELEQYTVSFNTKDGTFDD